MEKLTYTTTINADADVVWDKLWGYESYQEWTKPFSSGSKAESDWQEGSKVLFLDGSGNGMVARIVQAKRPETMFLEHIGEVKDGVEDYDSDSVKTWAGSREDYTLKAVSGGTELVATVDVGEDWKDMMNDKFPKSLAILKEISENAAK